MTETIEDKCLSKGVKLTDQRRIIAQVMSKSTDHPRKRVQHRALKPITDADPDLIERRKRVEVEHRQVRRTGERGGVRDAEGEDQLRAAHPVLQGEGDHQAALRHRRLSNPFDATPNAINDKNTIKYLEIFK